VSKRWRARAAPAAAVVLGVLVLGLAVASVVVDSLSHQSPAGGPAADAFITAAGVVPATAIGTLLAARRPRNPIGWLLLVVIIAEGSPAGQYLILDYRMHNGTLPLGWLAVVLEEDWPIFLVSVTLLLWLFPDGTLPSGRWHRAAEAAAIGWVLVALATFSRGVLVAAGGDVRIQADGSLANPSPAVFRVLGGVVTIGAVVSWVAWLASQIPTYRHASGVHRQQLKWLYSGAVIFVTAYIGVFIITFALEKIPGFDNQSVVNALAILGSAALPVCMGVAVLKYRLYELNRVISRVIAYTLITVLLGGVFAGLVLLATRVLPVKGSVAVAVATLVIAALFNPLRKRVQRAVDRRFNRSRYDAEEVVAAFTARMRRTIDLDAIQDDLVGAVHQAFQPTHASLWLPNAHPHATTPTVTRTGGGEP
jgi:divalent metal cation (Fe/Co/Zn/Cd) transporter